MKGLLLDLDGVVYVGHTALPGSLEAIRHIRDAGIPLRFITNTTRRPRRRIVADLAKLGLEVEAQDVFTPAAIAREVLIRLNLTPFLVVHPDLQEEFAGLPAGNADAVVIGDAGSFFTYDLLNQAYRKILHGAELLALAKNRNFLDHDHELSLDAGPFVSALEFASGETATILGKPSPTFFALAVESMGCAPEDVVMIGDDAEADIGGAMAAGLDGILVQTGKYRPGQEAALPQRPTHVAPNLWAAVTFLCEESL
jgi:HAD superfamily hydrolase (TIGR01458 family)